MATHLVCEQVLVWAAYKVCHWHTRSNEFRISMTWAFGVGGSVRVARNSQIILSGAMRGVFTVHIPDMRSDGQHSG